MTRDMDLIRTIMAAVEALPAPLNDELAVDGYEPPVVAEHMHLLREAGYLECHEVDAQQLDYCLFWPTRLTWQGHEFLAAVRNDTIWKQLKAKAESEGGSLPAEILKAVAMGLLKKHFGLSG